MIKFLLTFLSIYSAMHIFVFLRLRVLLPERGLIQFVCVCFMVCMIVAPIGVRLLERVEQEHAARVLAWTGYSWMAFIFLCFCILVSLALLDLAFHRINRIAGLHSLSIPIAIQAWIAISLGTMLCLHGFVKARDIRVERVVLETRKLPADVSSIKIAQISDVHLGLLVREKRLERIVDKIRKENPDLLVSTGDLVDGQMDHLDGISQLLEQLKPPLGKFAVTGNHELYAGLPQALEFTQKCGFTVLRNEGTTVGNLINVVGVDDEALGTGTDEAAVLSMSGNGLFTIFLRHRPVLKRENSGLFDLQLSGHTHRGQIFPFRYAVGFQYPLQDGLYQMPDGSALYTSRGSGTWGPPIRVLSPPEVTIIELMGAHPAQSAPCGTKTPPAALDRSQPVSRDPV